MDTLLQVKPGHVTAGIYRATSETSQRSRFEQRRVSVPSSSLMRGPIRTASQICSIIVSIPINLSSPEDNDLAAFEEKGVKGSYASVERILELSDGGVEWRMATSSSAGGLVPQFVNDIVLPEVVSKVSSRTF